VIYLLECEVVKAADTGKGGVLTVNIETARLAQGDLVVVGWRSVVRERVILRENDQRFKVSLAIVLMRRNETLKAEAFKIVESALVFTHAVIL
jgi:hypothetical protein